jgi:hypothetical protein
MIERRLWKPNPVRVSEQDMDKPGFEKHCGNCRFSVRGNLDNTKKENVRESALGCKYAAKCFMYEGEYYVRSTCSGTVRAVPERALAADVRSRAKRALSWSQVCVGK